MMRAVILFSAVLVIASSMSCPPEEDTSPCTCTADDDPDVDLTLTCSEEEGVTLEVLTRVMRAFPAENSLAIELDGIPLGRLPSKYFENVNVKKLDISHCDLDGLTREDGKPLEGLENTLEELIIMSSFTDDSSSPKLDLSHLNRLRVLELSYNSITELGDDWFRDGPPSLSELVLSNNGIETLGRRSFEGLTGLTSLSLDGNRFGPVTRSMLPQPATRLATLELDNNALTDLPEDMFSGMPSLNVVSLRTNGLRKMPRETFEPVWQQLETLDMRGNSLECDSHLKWMFQVKTMTRVFGKCFSPPEKEGVELEDLIKGRVLL